MFIRLAPLFGLCGILRVQLKKYIKIQMFFCICRSTENDRTKVEPCCSWRRFGNGRNLRYRRQVSISSTLYGRIFCMFWVWSFGAKNFVWKTRVYNVDDIDSRPSPVMTLMAHYKSPPLGVNIISHIWM